jgi:Domain of unknown function (DUF4116)
MTHELISALVHGKSLTVNPATGRFLIGPESIPSSEYSIGHLNELFIQSFATKAFINLIKTSLTPSALSTLSVPLDHLYLKIHETGNPDLKKVAEKIKKIVSQKAILDESTPHFLRIDKAFVIDDLMKTREALGEEFALSKLTCVSKELTDLEDFWLDLINREFNIINYLPKNFYNSPSCLLKIMAINPSAVDLSKLDAAVVSDCEFIKQAVFLNPYYAFSLTEEMRFNKEVILSVFQGIQDISIKSQARFFSKDLHLFYSLITEAPLLISQDSEFILEVLKHTPGLFQSLPISLKNNKDFVLRAVELGLDCAQYFSDEFIHDSSFMTLLINKNHSIFKYADESLRSNPELIVEVVRKDHKLIAYVDSSLKSDIEFIKKLILLEPTLYAWADESLKLDISLATYAITLSSKVIPLLPQSLFFDSLFCLKLIDVCPEAYQVIHKSLFSNKEIVKAIIDKGILSATSKIDPSLFEEKDVMELLIAKHGLLLGKASSSLQNDPELVMKALKHTGSALRYASDELANHKAIVLEAVKQDGLALEYASFDLQNDIDVIRMAFDNNPMSLHYASEAIRRTKSYAIEFLSASSSVIPFFVPFFLNDKDVAIACVSQEARSFRMFTPELQKDKDVAIAALRQDPTIYNRLHYSLIDDPDVREIILLNAASSIEKAFYLPAAIPDRLKAEFLETLDAVEEGSYEHLLEDDLRVFIDSLTKDDLDCLDEARADELKFQYHQSLNDLIDKIKTKRPYTGTPPEHKIEALLLFYETVVGYLNFLDSILRSDPSKRIERLQILRGAGACGGGLLSELEQLHSILSYKMTGMDLGQRLASWRSWEIRSFVESEVLSLAQAAHAVPNLHDRNIMLWQLKDFITGKVIAEDHLAHQKSLTELLMKLFTKKSVRYQVDSLSRELEIDEGLKEAALEYINSCLFVGIQPSCVIKDRIKEEDSEILELISEMNLIRSVLEIEFPGASSKTAIHPILFSPIAISPSVDFCKKQIERILKREITLPEARLYFDKKPSILEFKVKAIRLQEIASVTVKEFYTLSHAELLALVEARLPDRIMKIQTDEFYTAYRNADGSLKPEGLVLVLEKLGLVRRV